MIEVKFKLDESEVEIIYQRAKELSEIKNPLVEELVECYVFDEILDAVYGADVTEIRRAFNTAERTINAREDK